MSKQKKIIGITGPSIHTPAVRSMVEKFLGAIPVDINQNGTDIDAIANFCDSFILAGGVDIFPMTLNAGLKRENFRHISHGCNYTKFDRKRDYRELRLIELAKKSGKKLLGICRGHQMILSNRGFYLIEDISRYSEIAHSASGIELDNEPIHYVDAYGDNGSKFVHENDCVNSYHHQAIDFNPEFADEVGVEILATAHTVFEDDKRGEQKIIELARGDDFLSCQWHPEVDWETNETSRRVLQAYKDMLG